MRTLADSLFVEVAMPATTTTVEILPSHRNSQPPIDIRLNDWISRMTTLEEKISSMMYVALEKHLNK